MLIPNGLRRLIVIVLIAITCVSCARSESEPTVSPSAQPTEQAVSVPTETPAPTSTLTPTNSPTPSRTPPPTPTRTPKPTQTPKGPQYGTRSNPYYVGERAVLTYDTKRVFEIGLTEVVRGSEALDFIQRANQFNDPAPDDMEFVVAKVELYYHPNGEGLLELDEGLWSGITKGRVFGYWDKPEQPCCLEPEFDMRLFPGGTSFGYMAWPVYQDDPNPQLAFALSSDGSKGWYFALEAPSDDSPQPRPTPAIPDEAVTQPKNPELGSFWLPYSIGETAQLVKGGNLEFEISISKVLRGSDALNFVKRANQFNDPPPKGFEFVVVEVFVKYTGKESGILELSEEYWNVVTQGRVFDRFEKPADPCCLEPPFEISLLSGGEAKGYMAWAIHQDDPNPLLVFGLSSDGEKGWYFSLTQ